MPSLLRTSSSPQAVAGRLVGVATAPMRLHARVAVWGIKGGVGTTTVAVLAGMAVARHQAGPIVVADESLYGSLAIRAGLVLPAEPLIAPGSATDPTIVIGQPAPYWTLMTLLDAPPAGAMGECDIVVVSATVDAVLMAHEHHASLVVLTHLTAKPAVDTAAARHRLGGEVIELPFDPHLATGGPIAWDRLQPATRDAARHLAAALITALPRDVPVPIDETE